MIQEKSKFLTGLGEAMAAILFLFLIIPLASLSLKASIEIMNSSTLKASIEIINSTCRINNGR